MARRAIPLGSSWGAALLCMALGGCGTSPSPGADAGPTFTVDLTAGRFGDPLPSVTAEELASFKDGKDAFLKQENVGSGLGPVFNQPVCTQCHDSPPAIGGSNQRLETRYGRRLPDGGFDPLTEKGGTLLHDHGIGPVSGASFNAEVIPPEANVVAARRTQPVFGLGLVDATPDTTFQALAEAQARDAPAGAGRPAMVIDRGTHQRAVGRFGWKANAPTLFEFSGDAALNEMGITSPQFPDEICPQGDCSLLAYNPEPTLNDPEGRDIARFTAYTRFLGPPPAPVLTGQVKRGSEVFAAIGCAVCHVPTLITGPSSSAALDRVAYHPYSDFLLHDMGALGDGIDQADARGPEMRTQPLWGLSFQTRMLHDGRAVTVPAAITAHDGQAAGARDRFVALGDEDRAALLAFLA
ncbi:MAG TPA: di-heme oxidoredictase family protein, partial [Myxococcaceae bacterium]|nr:di-heme oxidoredictase family protein [Myxococcaceae bacterium]